MKIIEQKGSVLLISLIMLVVISMIAVSSIRSNQTQSIMTDNFLDKSNALKSAESMLTIIESWLVNEQFTFFDLMGESCAQVKCFNESCLDGLCLTGSIDRFGQCVNSLTQPFLDDVLQSNYPLIVDGSKIIVWEDEKYHQTVDQISSSGSQAKFIVEFYCFDSVDLSYNDDALKNNAAWHPVYRITVMEFGTNRQNKVMLQSLFMVGSL